MSTTWAVISCSVPSYIPVDYSIITYEIGYNSHQSNGSCSPNDEFSPLIKTNTSSINVTISDLIGNTCYLFGYTVNEYGLWTVIGDQTLVELLTIVFSVNISHATTHNHSVNYILSNTTIYNNSISSAIIRYYC